MMDTDAMRGQVESYVDEVWEDVVEDIRTLVRIDSVEDLEHAEPGKPWGPKSYEALEAALGIAARLGLETQLCEGYIGYGDLPGKSAKQIATIAHSDIVPTGEGWTVPALDVTRKEGYLLGRGVLDDKGPLVLSLYAAKFFVDEVARTGERLPYTLRCIVGNCEETSMGDLHWYLKHYEAPAFCFTPDANFPLICGEKGILHGHFESAWPAGSTIVSLTGGTVANAVAGKATALVRGDASSLRAAPHISLADAGDGCVLVTAIGKGGHASLPEGTTNAIGLLASFLLDELALDEGERRFLELARALCTTWDGAALGIDARDEAFGALTCVGGTVSTTGDKACLSVDIRYPTSTSADRLIQGLTGFGQSFGARFELDINKDPFYIEPSSPEIEALLAGYREYARPDGEAFTIGGGTYARMFPKACAFGPFDPSYPDPEWVGMEHGPDEGVSEETLRRALKIYIVSIARLMELDL